MSCLDRSGWPSERASSEGGPSATNAGWNNLPPSTVSGHTSSPWPPAKVIPSLKRPPSPFAYLARFKLPRRLEVIDADADMIAYAQANMAGLGLGNVTFDQISLADFDAPQSYDAIAGSTLCSRPICSPA